MLRKAKWMGGDGEAGEAEVEFPEQNVFASKTTEGRLNGRQTAIAVGGASFGGSAREGRVQQSS